tara:strand:+ start:28 stop:285 length:258 start_codon:yes stop_codon:yes gene_type:complete
MNKIIRKVIACCIGLSCVLLLFVPTVQATKTLKNKEPEKVDKNKQIQTNLDEIFGPDLNFPFRPESHRDNSSPISRITPEIENDE